MGSPLTGTVQFARNDVPLRGFLEAESDESGRESRLAVCPARDLFDKGKETRKRKEVNRATCRRDHPGKGKSQKGTEYQWK